MKEKPRGFVKVIVAEESGKILGVHIIGASATELIAEAVTAIQLDATVRGINKLYSSSSLLFQNLSGKLIMMLTMKLCIIGGKR